MGTNEGTSGIAASSQVAFDKDERERRRKDTGGVKVRGSFIITFTGPTDSVLIQSTQNKGHLLVGL